MKIQPGVWGIDLGQCALKAIRLEELDGVMTATAFDYVEHPKILSQPDADPDQLTREALEKFLSRNTLKGDVVSISVPGQSGLARFVKLPPVEEKKIADIVRFEAKQQIPFNLDEVVWDYQRIGSGDVTDGFAMNIEIGLFAMKRDMINRYLQHFKDVGVEIHLVQMAPLALCNFVAYDMLGKGARVPGAEEDEEKPKCVVALDIGADSSNLVITDAERVIWQRPIPLGGNHFTRALTKELKLTFAKAEHLKRNAMKSPDLKKILTALKPVLNDFVGEVQRSLGYFTNTHRDAQIEYMIGLGNAFRLPGLQRYLGEKLSLEVRKLGKMTRLHGEGVLTQPTFSENVLTFGVAYGLALQGIKHARLLTNLLPHEIRMERLVRGKKPWAAAAAALLLLGAGAWAFTAAREDNVYANSDVTDAIKNAKDTVDAVTTMETRYTDAQKAARKEEEAVRSIVAGQPEFKNWLELTKFVSDSLPQPNGLNLADKPVSKEQKFSPKQMYWVTRPTEHLEGVQPMSGEEAFAALNARLSGKFSSTGDSTIKDEFIPGIDNLVEINLDSFDARFCDDLAAFWSNAPDTAKNIDNVRPRDQAKKGPEGKGWIIEIQGYTYHHAGVNFVRDTLMETLATKGIPVAPPAPAPGNPAPPAPGNPAPPAPGKPATAAAADTSLDIPPDGPVLKCISHVMLLRYATAKVHTSNTPITFEILGKSKLTELAKGAKADSSAGGKAGGSLGPTSAGSGNYGGIEFWRFVAAPVNPRDLWTPLGTLGSRRVLRGRRGRLKRPGRHSFFRWW